MATDCTAKVVEHIRVGLPHGSVVTTSLPLTYLDLPWLHCPLIHHIFFHEYLNSTSHFMEFVIPNLKNSLSLTLKYYFPLAGNLIIPSDSTIPELSYVKGGSVSLTFAESTYDFDDLTANHPKDSDQFYHLVPKMPPVSSSAGKLVVPLMAVQVTLFPNSGISIGFTFRRVAADGNAFTGFIRTLASITKSSGEGELAAVPFYARNVIQDPKGLDKKFWNQIKKKKFEGSQPEYVPTNKVRATFLMAQSNVQRLKKRASIARPSLAHVSTFTMTCAYVWSCMAKSSREAIEKIVDENEFEHFIFGADCRSLLYPSIPPNYFGNCLVNCVATLKTSQLVQEDGFLIAAEAIAESIQERVRSKEGVLKGIENLILDYEARKNEKCIGISGSPKFAVYDTDFGWGKPRKSEVISIDTTGSFSLNECRDSKGDMEIGLSFPKVQMDAFAAIYDDGIQTRVG